MLAYFLKVNVAIVLFYAFYRLFFYKDTFFGWRRTALLCFFAVSAAVPLLNIQTWITEQEPMVAMADLYASVVLPELTVGTEVAPTDWKSILSEYANIAYWGIVALLMIRLIMQLAGIIRLTCRCRKIQIGNTSIHLLPKADGPFSFFHWIFIHPSSHTEEEFNEILTHEQTHARQWHSIDVIISELVCIFCWCNPFAWLMKREIRTNLEYMADARVLENGYDSKTYQYHLLGLSHQKAAVTIYNSFNVLPLKKRIKMMNKKRTKEIGRTKYLMFLPLAALLMIVSNIETVARTTKKIAVEVIEAVDPQTEQPAPEVQDPQVAPQPEQDTKTVTYKGKVVDKDGKPIQGVKILSVPNSTPTEVTTQADGSFEFKASPKAKLLFLYQDGNKKKSISFTDERLPKENKTNWTIVYNEKWNEVMQSDPGTPDNPIFEVVEHMPEFTGGGMPALMEYLSKNIKYPEAAMKKGIQGRGIVQFVVEKDGSITNVKILRGVDPELDKEAVRVVSAMPKWKPGTQRGEAVRVRFTVPVMFRLTEDKIPVKYAPIENKINELVVVGYAPEGTTVPEEGTIFEVVEQMPEYPGGMPAMMEFISKNIKYPAAAQQAKIQGRVTIQFIVNTEGNIINPRVLRSADPLLDAEAIRLTTIMPKWKPGMQRGQAVNVKYTVPIMFRLQEPEKSPAVQNATVTPTK
ncbi:M56 family metallopeptidase [Bacteroides sp. CACC 737]|uniref:M56 family metallopeptidase n=1 Tax=Bacteroides sp. CACC 737 TaxID=2755405 RepID=UPI0015EEFBB0|nr:M56 family metallopeptidase [Bacteroides sp. CACC 737]QMI79302.1 TonB family protein [Bacteroides sp. CACC 737]